MIFTYDVVFEESDVEWAHRWDVYLRGNPDDKIHWFVIGLDDEGDGAIEDDAIEDDAMIR